MDFFLEVTAKILNGDLTYVEQLKRIIQQAHDLAKGKIKPNDLEDTYREIVIHLVHLDSPYLAQKKVLDLKPKTIKYLRNLVLPNTPAGRIKYNKTKKAQKRGQSGCGCY